jgi:hypothetical protein
MPLGGHDATQHAGTDKTTVERVGLLQAKPERKTAGEPSSEDRRLAKASHWRRRPKGSGRCRGLMIGRALAGKAEGLGAARPPVLAKFDGVLCGSHRFALSQPILGSDERSETSSLRELNRYPRWSFKSATVAEKRDGSSNWAIRFTAPISTRSRRCLTQSTRRATQCKPAARLKSG